MFLEGLYDFLLLDFGHAGGQAVGTRVRETSLFFDGLKLEKFIDLLGGDLDLYFGSISRIKVHIFVIHFICN